MTAPHVIQRSRHELGGLLAGIVTRNESLPIVVQEQLVRQLLDLQTKFDRVATCR